MRVLKPGFLISLKTNRHGGVKIRRRSLDVNPAETEVVDESVTSVTKSEVTTIIADKNELKAAEKLRGKLRYAVAQHCAWSEFGLLAPRAKIEVVRDAFKEAKEEAKGWNANHTITRVDIFMLEGAIAENEAAASQAAASEIKDLIEEMKSTILSGNVDYLRKNVLKKATQFQKMLDGEAATKFGAAIEEVRKAAREIVKGITKGEGVAEVVAKLKLDALSESQFSFLDMEDLVEIPGEALPPVVVSAVDISEPVESSSDDDKDDGTGGADVDASAAVDADAMGYAAGPADLT
jgi:hypothetical protein